MPTRPGGPSWSCLRAGEATLGELAEPFDMSLQAVALHLKVLERGGLITRGRVAQTRPARIAPGPLDNAVQWLLRYREFWEGSFERLDGYLEGLQEDWGPS